METVMTITLGKDWKNYFDICVANARKPLFYRAESPFSEYDPEAENRKGNKVKDAADLEKNKIVIEGNAVVLTNYFSRLVKKDDPRIVFFGDNYLSDVHATNAFNDRLVELECPARWDSIAVIEELESLDARYSRM